MDSGFTYATFLIWVRYAVFWLAIVVAIIALIDWSVRTRRLNPFGPIGRFSRRFFDPLMRPVERRLVRSGGLPAHAPWWTLGVVVVGGLLLITVLDYLTLVFQNVVWGMSSPGRFGVMVASWIFGLLKLAIMVRVISSWLRVSAYSRWVRWAFWLTEWILEPLRRVIPPFGVVDITPFVAYLIIVLLQRAIGIP